MLFEDTLGSSKSMAGRQVYEAQNGASNDSCWYSGSPYEPYHLSGGGWYVGYYGFGNKVSFDYVGLDPQIYQWYYSQGKTPCVMSAPQQMLIYKNGGSESYFQTTITISMQPPWYGVAKNGVQAWRQF